MSVSQKQVGNGWIFSSKVGCAAHFLFHSKRGKCEQKLCCLEQKKNVQWNRCNLGCTAHFSSKQGKCEQKSFRLEKKRTIFSKTNGASLIFFSKRVKCKKKPFCFELKKISSETGAPYSKKQSNKEDWGTYKGQAQPAACCRWVSHEQQEQPLRVCP